jgi:hypothetical protein
VFNPAYTAVGQGGGQRKLDGRSTAPPTCSDDVLAAAVALAERTAGNGLQVDRSTPKCCPRKPSTQRTTVLKTAAHEDHKRW